MRAQLPIDVVGCSPPRTPGSRSTTSRSQSPSALHPSDNACPRACSVRPNFLEPRDEGSESSEQATRTKRLMHISRRHGDRKWQAYCVNSEMPFAPLDMLVGVKPRDAGRFLDGLHALRVSDGSTRLGVFAYALTFRCTKMCEESIPVSFETKASEVGIDRLPRWKA